MKRLSPALIPKLLTYLLVAIAVAAPVLFSIQQSWKQSRDDEMEHVLAYARDVQGRTDATADQILAGINRLQQASEPCGLQNRLAMRAIDLGSSYIQAIGHVAGNRLVCSSLGEEGSGWELGPVDFYSSRGVALRLNVKAPFAPGSIFSVVERDGYAAIIHKSLPLDATTLEQDAALATFSLDNYRLLASRGYIDPAWAQSIEGLHEKTFFYQGYVVAVVHSKKYRTGSIAALPASYIDQKTRDLALMLVPIGLVAGLLLAYAAVYLARLQSSMPTLIKTALRQDEFFMLYQPVVELQTGRWIGAEALIRWRRSDGSLMRPDLFIPMAEEAGLITKITERVTELIARDAAGLFAKYPEFHLALNLSAADIHAEQTQSLLQALAQATRAKPGNLVAEATERGFMDADRARAMLHKLHQDGVSVAIDDFGTGYSCLSYLETFAVDYLKIDKSFVDKIGIDAPTSNVILHIIQLAKAMNLKMIAEGVENEAQAAFLREQGIPYAQGWLFSKPVGIKEIIEHLEAAKTV